MELRRRVWGDAKRILSGVAVLLHVAGPASGADDSRLFTSGFEAFSGGDSRKAARTLSHLLEAYPGTRLRELTLFYLARAHFRTGNQEDAAKAMARLLQEYPGTSLAGKAEKELLGLVARYRKGEKLSRGDDDLDVLPVGELAAVSAAPGSGASSVAEEDARKKAGQERLAREQAEREQAARRKAEEERLAREKADRERLAREEAERTRLAMEKEKAARKKAEQERLAREQAEREQAERQKAEEERLAREKADRERLAREEAERVRLAAEKEKVAREKAERERVAREKAEREQAARQKAEAERALLAMRKEQPVREKVPTKRSSMPSPAATAPTVVSGAGIELSGPLLRAVVKSEKTELSPGERVEYLVTLLNVGSGRAEGVALRLMFPDGEYEPVDFARSGFRNEGGGALVLDNVAIDSGQALDYPVVFRVRNDAVIGQELRCSVRLLNGAIGTWDSYRSRASFVRAPRRP